MKRFLIVCLLVGALMSCNKNASYQFYAYPGLGINDTSWTNQNISKGFIDTIEGLFGIPFYTATFSYNTDESIRLNDSLQIAFSSNAFADANTNIPITNGNIKVDVDVLRNKGDFIKELIATTSTKYLLASAGAFYVQISQNNNPLIITPAGSFTLKWQDASPNTNANFFGLIPLANIDSLNTWVANKYGTVSTWDSTNNGVNKKGYSLSSKITGTWISANAFLDTVTTTRTRANVLMSSANFTNKNTLVFMVFKNQRTVVKLNPDYANRCFYSLNIPIGSAVTLFSISIIDNTFYLGNTDVVVSSANKLSLLPQKATLPDIFSALNNL